jgi:integrase/recombinase XerC
VNKADKIGGALSSAGIFNVVRRAGQAIGKPGLAPHDLRRSYAQLGLSAGVPITQISKLLGHSSVAITQRYLNLELDLDETISDFIPVPRL